MMSRDFLKAGYLHKTPPNKLVSIRELVDCLGLALKYNSLCKSSKVFKSPTTFTSMSFSPFTCVLCGSSQSFVRDWEVLNQGYGYSVSHNEYQRAGRLSRCKGSITI